MAKSKMIDTLPKFEAWLNSQFDAVQAADRDNFTILREASLIALRIGAGDIVGPIAGKPAQTETLAALGKLLAWCRSQPDSRLLWDADQAATMLGLSARTLWQLTNRGDIPCIRPTDKMVRYSPESLRQWIADKAEIGVASKA